MQNKLGNLTWLVRHLVVFLYWYNHVHKAEELMSKKEREIQIDIDKSMPEMKRRPAFHFSYIMIVYRRLFLATRWFTSDKCPPSTRLEAALVKQDSADDETRRRLDKAESPPGLCSTSAASATATTLSSATLRLRHMFWRLRRSDPRIRCIAAASYFYRTEEDAVERREECLVPPVPRWQGSSLSESGTR